MTSEEKPLAGGRGSVPALRVYRGLAEPRPQGSGPSRAEYATDFHIGPRVRAQEDDK